MPKTSIAAAAAALLLAAVAHAQTGPLSIDIPAQPLDKALGALARQSGARIVFSTGLTESKAAPGVHGSLTVQQALQQLLAGSGLSARPAADGGYTVAPQDQGGAALEGASLPAVSVAAEAESSADLPQPYAGGQVARGGRLGLLGNVDVMDAPFNITSYTARTIEDQQARNVADLLGRNDPSVRVTGGEGSDTDTLRIRGFDVAMEDSTFNGLPGLLSFYRSKVEFIERIEVLKGPNAMLNGMAPGGGVGGAVNVVSKRAGDQPMTRLTAGYLADSRADLHADIGRRFGVDNAWGVRVNGALRRGESSRDDQKQSHDLGSVALDYRGQQLRASIDYVYQSMRDRASRTALTVGSATAGWTPRAPSGDTNFTQPWAVVRSGNRTLVGRVEYDITPDLTVHAALGRSKGWFDGKGSGNIALTSVSGDIRGAAGGSAFHLDTTSGEIGITGRFTTGPIRHQWSAALSALERDMAYGFSSSAGAVVSNIYAPVHVPEPAGIQPAVARLSSRSRLPSFGIADTLSFAQDRVRLTLGVRRQTVRTDSFDTSTGAVSSRYDESATSPFVGLVVRPWEGGAVYANVIQGLAQGGTAPDTAVNAGEVFPPYKTKQYELGIKHEWNGFGGSASVFQIAKPSGLLDATTLRYEASGEQRHRGIELNVFGELARGLRLLGGATWIDARMTQAASASVVGKRPVGVPRFTANLSGEWDVPGLPGFTLTGGLTHTGSSYVDAANATLIPGWTRIDLGARWTTRVADRAITFRASLENAFNKRYWSVGTWNALLLGMPRTLALSATVDF